MSGQTNSEEKTGISSSLTLLNVVNAFTGCGRFAMPYALAQGGWLSLIALLLVGMICSYTALLLQQCMVSNALVRSYLDIGQLAFGPKGRTLMMLLMNSELYFVAVGQLIIEGDSFDSMFSGIRLNLKWLHINGKQCFILLSIFLILPTTWPRNLKVLSYLSVGGIIVPLILVFLFIWVGTVQGVGFHQKGELMIWSQMPMVFSIYTFSYSAHSVVPILYASMKDSTKFSKVLIIGLAISTLLNGLMSVIGYLMFGVETKSMMTLNLPSHMLTSKIATWMVIMIPLVKYALCLMPLINSIEENFHIKARWLSILLRTFVVLTTTAIAASMPYFAFVTALTGSLISSMANIIMPCLCYLKVCKSSLKFKMKTMVIKGVLVFGALIATSGTYVSISNIMHAR